MTAIESAAASMLRTGEGDGAVGFAGPSLPTPGAESDAQTALPIIQHGALQVCQAILLARACARLTGRKLAQAAERVAERLAKRIVQLTRDYGPGRAAEYLDPNELRAAIEANLSQMAFGYIGYPSADGRRTVERLLLLALGPDGCCPAPLLSQPLSLPDLPNCPSGGLLQPPPLLQRANSLTMHHPPAQPLLGLSSGMGTGIDSFPPPMGLSTGYSPALSSGLGTGNSQGLSGAGSGQLLPQGPLRTGYGACLGPSMGSVGGRAGLVVDVEDEERMRDVLTRAEPVKVHAFRGACYSLLRRVLSPTNCFSLLRLGSAARVPELEEAAMLVAIANFPAAVKADRKHFLQLPADPLLLIVSNSNLQICHELDVWQAVADWVSYDPAGRRDQLHDLIRGGVRLEQMDALELSQLQRHPLLVEDAGGPAAALVGSAYSSRMLSNVHRSRSGSHRRPTYGGASSYDHGGYGGGSERRRGSGGGAGGMQQAAAAQQVQQPKPGLLALQQLIGSLQARAAAARARQQQRMQQEQEQQQQDGAHASAGGGGQSNQRAGGEIQSGSPPRSPCEDNMQTDGRREPGAGAPRQGATAVPPAEGPRGMASPMTSPASKSVTLSPGVGGRSPNPLAAALASAIVQAAAKQGLPRISLGVGEGGHVAAGAVKAALSAAQKQLQSDPALQHMIRQAQTAIKGVGDGKQSQEQQQQLQEPGGAAAGMPDEKREEQPAGDAGGEQLAAGGAAGSPGGVALSQHALTLNPQQLLQIAAAVQKAAASGQAQPPHVRQQLQQLQGVLARHIAQVGSDSPHQPLLMAVQQMLASASASASASSAGSGSGSGPGSASAAAGAAADGSGSPAKPPPGATAATAALAGSAVPEPPAPASDGADELQLDEAAATREEAPPQEHAGGEGSPARKGGQQRDQPKLPQGQPVGDACMAEAGVAAPVKEEQDEEAEDVAASTAASELPPAQPSAGDGKPEGPAPPAETPTGAASEQAEQEAQAPPSHPVPSPRTSPRVRTRAASQSAPALSPRKGTAAAAAAPKAPPDDEPVAKRLRRK